MTDVNKNHSSGRQIGEVGIGISIHIEKKAESVGGLKCYAF